MKNVTNHNSRDFDTESVDLEKVWRAEDSHFWYCSRNRWILGALERLSCVPGDAFLEVGCGSGTVLRALRSRGFSAKGVETEEELVKMARCRCGSDNAFCQDIRKTPLDLSPVKAIGFFDVLEHLDRPEDLIQASFRYAKSGTIFLVTVPAYQSDFTLYDELGGHKKRYDPGDLRRLFEDCGLQFIYEEDFFKTIRFLIKFRRAMNWTRRGRVLGPEETKKYKEQELVVPVWPINSFLGWLSRLEYEGKLPLFGMKGASIIGAARMT